MFEEDEISEPEDIPAAILQWRDQYALAFHRIGRPGPVAMKVQQELGLRLGLIPGRCGVVSGILIRSTGG
jgi:hypothetical protein